MAVQHPSLALGAALSLLVVLASPHAHASPSQPSALHQLETTAVDEAVRSLGRYAAGHLPPSAEVQGSLSDLAALGGKQHLPLLQALARDESPEVGLWALQAREQVLGRAREAQRADARLDTPRDEDIGAWLLAHGESLLRSDGTQLGEAEARTVAYAALALGTSTISPEEQARPDLLRQAKDHEDRGEISKALVRYTVVAAQGDLRALRALEAYGLDPERLVLGMATSPGPQLAPTLATDGLELLATQGTGFTVEVLVERANTGGPRARIVAIDALGRMLRTAELSPGNRSKARQELMAATEDPRGLVRDAARLSLAGAGVGSRVRGTVVPLP